MRKKNPTPEYPQMMWWWFIFRILRLITRSTMASLILIFFWNILNLCNIYHLNRFLIKLSILYFYFINMQVKNLSLSFSSEENLLIYNPIKINFNNSKPKNIKSNKFIDKLDKKHFLPKIREIENSKLIVCSNR